MCSKHIETRVCITVREKYQTSLFNQLLQYTCSHHRIGRPLIVFVNITHQKNNVKILLAHFEGKMSLEPEVMQYYFVSSDINYLLIIHVQDMQHYNEFARRVFANEANIKQFRSSFCLKLTKYHTNINLPVF